MELQPKVQIESFQRDDDYIWLDFADGSSDTINVKRFEKWLVEDRPHYLQLNHGRTAASYRDVCLDVEAIYTSERIIEILTEYLEVPTVIRKNNFRTFQTFDI